MAIRGFEHISHWSAGPVALHPTRRFQFALPVVDARYWQIVSLGILLAYGKISLGFDQSVINIIAVFAGALATQAVFSAALRLPHFDPLSPIITSLSLSILLRANSFDVMALAGFIAMASKFIVRVNGKHVFNPANGAIVALLAMDLAWISPAQWGSKTLAAFLFASLAGLVLSRAKRADIAIAFLATFVALLFVRAFYLGDPLAIPLKQMQSGAVLLFAFFMISDPKTTPDRRGLRIAFAMSVAIFAHVLIFWNYIPEGLMYALFVLSPAVPLLDRWRPIARAARFTWSRPTV